MKIAILGSRGVPAAYGGFEVFAENLGVALTQRGHQVYVSCPKDQKFQEKYYRGMNLVFVWLPRGAIGTLLHDALSLFYLCRLNCDVILMLGYASSPALLISKMFGKKVVTHMDGMEWQRSKWVWYAQLWLRIAERVAVMLSQRIVVDSRAIGQYYEEKYRIKGVFIPYGTELYSHIKSEQALSSYGLTQNEYYLTVMRLEPENSILEMVRGFLSTRTNRKLVIVGLDTPFFRRSVLPIVMAEKERILLLGPIYDRKAVSLLRQNAFAYIHGHTVGGTNPSLLDAMGDASYIIAKDVQFNREVLEGCGSYFEDEKDLVKRIETLESSPPEEISKKRMEAQHRVKNSYSWEGVTASYLSLFTNIVQSEVL